MLSPDEVVRLLDCVTLPKHRAILTICYAVGLRISEAVRLRPPDLDSRLHSLQQAFDAGRLRFTGFIEPLADPATFARHLARARATDWVVYAKRPFAGPRQVLDYVGRYTHRVAISNSRHVDLTDDQVRFRWKDYLAQSQQKTMTLAATEFIRRFLLHVLPGGFQRIRYYGLLGNRHRTQKLARCRQLLGMTPRPVSETSMSTTTPRPDYCDRVEALTGLSLRICPICHDGCMVEIVADVGQWAYQAVVDTS